MPAPSVAAAPAIVRGWQAIASTALLMAASVACTAFGNALQPISVLAWVQPVLLLLANEALQVGAGVAEQPLSCLLGLVEVWS